MPLTEHNARFIPIEKYKAKLLANRRIEGECWLWTGPTYRKAGNLDNYGHLYIRELDLKIKVCRLSLMLFKPEEFRHNLNVNHKCSRKLCFNPDHLYAGTDLQNTFDRLNEKTGCIYGHPYSETNTYIYKNGRECKICRADARRRFRK